MSTHIEKNQENETQAHAHEDVHKQLGEGASLQFADKRPVALVQRKMQEAIANSSAAPDLVKPTIQPKANAKFTDSNPLKGNGEAMEPENAKHAPVGQLKAKSSHPIQRVKIGKDSFTAHQSAYKFFKFSGPLPPKLRTALEAYDEKPIFTSETEFLEAFLKAQPEFSEMADQGSAKKKSIERNADLREEKMKATASPKTPLKVIIDAAALKHATDRHTVSGITAAKEILSATDGDVSVFPEKMSIADVAKALQAEAAVVWKPRTAGGVQADFLVAGVKVRVYGVHLGDKVSAETFFPPDSQIAREKVEKWFA